jgi:hypothetical protein
MGLVSGNWSVILDHDGLVKTACQLEKNMKSFSENQLNAKHKVYGQQLTDQHRETIKLLFN